MICRVTRKELGRREAHIFRDLAETHEYRQIPRPMSKDGSVTTQPTTQILINPNCGNPRDRYKNLGRGFDPHRPYHSLSGCSIFAVRRSFPRRACVGEKRQSCENNLRTKPPNTVLQGHTRHRKKLDYSTLWPILGNQRVGGSSPPRFTNIFS